MFSCCLRYQKESCLRYQKERGEENRTFGRVARDDPSFSRVRTAFTDTTASSSYPVMLMKQQQQQQQQQQQINTTTKITTATTVKEETSSQTITATKNKNNGNNNRGTIYTLNNNKRDWLEDRNDHMHDGCDSCSGRVTATQVCIACSSPPHVSIRQSLSGPGPPSSFSAE